MADIDDLVNFIDSTFQDIHNEYESIKDEELNNATFQTSADFDFEGTIDGVQEANKADVLNELQPKVDQETSETSESSKNSIVANFSKQELQAEIDARTVFVGNIHHELTMKELEVFFHKCGSIVQSFICLYKLNDNSIPFAYIEFAVMDSVDNALKMDGSLFKGRLIKVAPKTAGKPGYTK